MLAFPGVGAIRRLAFRLSADKLQTYFNVIEAAESRHSQWQCMKLAAKTLDKFDVPRPSIEAGPEVWLGFLAHVLVAADGGHLHKARMIHEEHGYERPSGSFGAPGPGPSLHAEWKQKETNWRQQTRSGREAARLIMTAPTLEEALNVQYAFMLTDGRMDASEVHWSFLYRVNMEKGDDAMMDLAGRIIDETAKRSETGVPDEIMIDEDSEDAKELISLYEGNAHWRQR